MVIHSSTYVTRHIIRAMASQPDRTSMNMARFLVKSNICAVKSADTPFSAAACKPRLAGARRVSAGSAQRAHVTASTLASSSSQTQRPAQRVPVCARILRTIFGRYHAVLVLQPRPERPRHCLGVALLLPSVLFSLSATQSVPLPPHFAASDCRISLSPFKSPRDTYQNAVLSSSPSTTIPPKPAFFTSSPFATGCFTFMPNLIGSFLTRKIRL